MNRDIRSLDTVTKQELEIIRTKTIGVIGAGGLGGYVIEMLARFGVGILKIIDGDVFDVSNLNRQLLSNEANLGQVKVEAAAMRVAAVNSGVQTEVFHETFNEENADEFLSNVDAAMDCLDNVKARLLLERKCKALNIPMVHGAVGAWSGQVMTIRPGDDSLRILYGEGDPAPAPVGAASFIPATIASYQVAECIKLLIGRGELLRHRMMYFDLLSNHNFVVDLKEA
jgi:molybdopterin/thiamine biosynthesis adenylyltransferase